MKSGEEEEGDEEARTRDYACCGPRRKNRSRRENSRWSGIGGGKPETRETEQRKEGIAGSERGKEGDTRRGGSPCGVVFRFPGCFYAYGRGSIVCPASLCRTGTTSLHYVKDGTRAVFLDDNDDPRATSKTERECEASRREKVSEGA